MTENPNIIDGQAVNPEAQPEAAESTAAGQAKAKTQPSGSGLKDAWKQVENIGQTLGEALQGRGNVVMVRVNDETLNHLDMLVEAEMDWNCRVRTGLVRTDLPFF